VVGIVIGGMLGAVIARRMSRLLFGIGAYDPITFAGAVSLLLFVALLGSFVPARRAAHVDPERRPALRMTVAYAVAPGRSFTM
jgi:putative ABC transport system permease protein